MFVTVIVFGMLTKLFLSSLLVYRTTLWWVPAVGLIIGGLGLGLLAHRQALALCAVAVGLPAMYVTHRVRASRSGSPFAAAPTGTSRPRAA